MKHHCTQDEARRLLGLFMDGQTTIAEEQLLADYFRQTEPLPAEWEDFRELFRELERLKPRPQWHRWLLAAAAVLALVLAVTPLWKHELSSAPHANAEEKQLIERMETLGFEAIEQEDGSIAFVREVKLDNIIEI